MRYFYDFFVKANYREEEQNALNFLVRDKFDGTSYAKKKFEVYSMQEELQSAGKFIPGMFYTFKYESEQKDEFYDPIPLCLCIGLGKDSILGFNFNLIMNDVRAYILDELVSFDLQFFKEELPRYLKNEVPRVSTVIGSIFLNKAKRIKFLEYIAQKYKIPTSSFAYRRYDISNIKQVSLIDYHLWKWIPFLNFNEGIRGKDLRDVQTMNRLDDK